VDAVQAEAEEHGQVTNCPNDVSYTSVHKYFLMRRQMRCRLNSRAFTFSVERCERLTRRFEPGPGGRETSPAPCAGSAGSNGINRMHIVGRQAFRLAESAKFRAE
jgi:hypothetical protein